MNTILNNQAWLLRREIWEHKAFWITPLIVSGLLLISMIWGLGAAISFGDNVTMAASDLDFSAINSDGVAAITMMHTWALFLPYALVLLVMSAFYCMDSLYGDRRDRSVLFWKSLPVSDTETVISKVATIIFVAPLITLVLLIATHVLALIFATVGILILGAFPNWYLIWHPGHLLMAWLMVANSLLVGSIILLPVYSWFLLASAWAKKAVFLWAVGTPLVVMFLEWQLFDTDYLADWFVDRATALFVYGFETTQTVNVDRLEDIGRLHEAVNVRWIWEVMATPVFWSGILISIPLIVGTIWLRRWRNED